AEFEAMLYEFKDGLQRYLQSSDAPVKTLDELIAFNRANAAREMPFFGQELFEQAAKKGPLTDAAYRKAAAQARALADRLQQDLVDAVSGFSAPAIAELGLREALTRNIDDLLGGS
ncbi:hypothetical protein C0075_25635, partial [Rhizobium sp. KAs_5_22]